ncbi:MAG: hypothetical protein H6624_10745 [Bdellovibrionaceae bacterium]|nr:hypothetical protein [Bdellovibrionales bacterium]MCB9084814.1 hypothetical protein [Pseudobdellovibrionaceae bacterium]
MSRELNRELFPDLQPQNKSAALPHQEREARIESLAPVLKEDWQILVAKIDILKKRIQEVETRQENFESRVSEWTAAVKSRFERFNSAGSRMEQFLKNVIHEVNEKFANLSSRVAERRLQETKIEEMMDRHNQVLQGYESRLSQIQKLVHEQEIQLMGAKASLEDARREIARLKRL